MFIESLESRALLSALVPISHAGFPRANEPLVGVLAKAAPKYSVSKLAGKWRGGYNNKLQGSGRINATITQKKDKITITADFDGSRIALKGTVSTKGAVKFSYDGLNSAGGRLKLVGKGQVSKNGLNFHSNYSRWVNGGAEIKGTIDLSRVQ